MALANRYSFLQVYLTTRHKLAQFVMLVCGKPQINRCTQTGSQQQLRIRDTLSARAYHSKSEYSRSTKYVLTHALVLCQEKSSALCPAPSEVLEKR